MMKAARAQLQIWGDLACFTRPELKAERTSYPIITPCAAIGVLESIFWKPEMRYTVTRIEVLRPIRWWRMRRNETSQLVPLTSALNGTTVDTVAHRDQRNTLGLRDVAYRIHARIDTLPNATNPPAAYAEQFRRRVQRGAAWQTPWLGMREFHANFAPPGPADWEPVGDDQKPTATPIPQDADLGIMLHSTNYATNACGWFHARMSQGVIDVPSEPIPGLTVTT